MSPGREGIAAGAALAAAITLIASVSADAETAKAETTKADKPSMIQASEAAKPASYNPKSLRRLDFRVVGKSCAVCLMGIQRKVKGINGVVKVAVMLRKPYGAVIIYDSSKISKDKLLETAKSQDKDVRIEQSIDNPIQKLPNILIPLYGVPKPKEASGDSQ